MRLSCGAFIVRIGEKVYPVTIVPHCSFFFTFIFKGSQHQGLFNMALSASQDLRMFNTTAITGNHRIRSNPCSIPCQQSPKLSQTDSQSPCTALTAGNLPAVRAMQETVSGLKNDWKFSPVLWAYNAMQLISNPLQMILPPNLYLDQSIAKAVKSVNWKPMSHWRSPKPPGLDCVSVYNQPDMAALTQPLGWDKMAAILQTTFQIHFLA